MIKFLEMREKLKNNAYPVLCVYGNDNWLRRKAIANICESLNVVDDGYNVDYLDNPVIADIKMACMTPALFCDKKIIVCENFVFPDGNKAQNVKQEIADIVKYYDGSFCLVFVADTEKNFDIAGVETINCNHLDKDNVSRWIVSFCKRQQVSVDSLCAGKLAIYCLCDMSRVAVETQKLIDYGEFTLESIEQLVHKDAEYIVYDLSQVIAAKNGAKAIETYRGLVASGEEPRALFALLYNFYRRAYYVKTSDFPTTELAEYLGVRAGAVSFAKDTAAKYKPMQLKRALDCFKDADVKLKAFVDDNEVMTTLILKLIAL